MEMLSKRLEGLSLPAVPENRGEIISTLTALEYGIVPQIPCSVKGRVISTSDTSCAGKAVSKKVELTLHLPGGEFSFPVDYTVPAAEGEHPLFILINFSSHVPDQYYPVEEIIDRGYGVLSAGYNDISKDAADDYAEGLGKLLRDAAREAGVAENRLPGKIAIWAYALSRMMDWALTQPGVKAEKTAVIGHSRLGKTALLAAMLDERFACVIANESGCSGAAITRGKPGEHVADITRVFPFWFCDEYVQYCGREEQMPFDQHWLLASIAPRLVCVASAEGDEWAGPSHEFLSCVAASPAWTEKGYAGFVALDRMPVPGDVFGEGDISYHFRAGKHYLSREDWNRYMDFLDAKGWKA